MKGKVKSGQLTALFLVFYGIFRIVAEFFREPDPQIGYIMGVITMGQILSCLMVVAGTILYLARNRIRR
jgi:phosphatidylglycerol:prolipoprotein diacylglycerol transferase